MIIPGGDTPLLDSELAVVTNYLDKGGHVIIMAGGRTNQDKQDLAAAPKLNDYLWSHFGLRFNDDVVLDPTNSIQSPFIPVATDVNTSHPIGKDFQPRSGLIFALPHSIEINPTAPENVTTDYIVRSSESSYAKTDYAALVAGNLDKTEGDQDGPLNLIAAADNSQTGAKVVLMGSTAPAEDLYTSGNNANLVTTVDAFVWATGFDINEFLTRSSVQSAQKPEDTPVSMDRQTAGTVNFITIVLLPFGILAVGLLVWWNNRETAH